MQPASLADWAMRSNDKIGEKDAYAYCSWKSYTNILRALDIYAYTNWIFDIDNSWAMTSFVQYVHIHKRFQLIEMQATYISPLWLLVHDQLVVEWDTATSWDFNATS